MRRITSTLRTPQGRRVNLKQLEFLLYSGYRYLQVSVVCCDATYLPVTKGADPHWRMDCYSGPIGKGSVMKVDPLCTPDGRPVAVRPGRILHTGLPSIQFLDTNAL